MKVVMAKHNLLLIDGEWYAVENIFNKGTKETVKDKLKRLILNNTPVGGSDESSQKNNN